MSTVQVIELGGKPAFYVVPAALWDKVSEAVEDAEDALDLARFDAEDDGVRLPLAVVEATLEGMHLVRAWREHRGLSQQALAAAAGVCKPFVSQIESGTRTGTTTTLKKLAKALGVPLGALVG